MCIGAISFNPGIDSMTFSKMYHLYFRNVTALIISGKVLSNFGSALREVEHEDCGSCVKSLYFKYVDNWMEDLLMYVTKQAKCIKQLHISGRSVGLHHEPRTCIFIVESRLLLEYKYAFINALMKMKSLEVLDLHGCIRNLPNWIL